MNAGFILAELRNNPTDLSDSVIPRPQPRWAALGVLGQAEWVGAA